MDRPKKDPEDSLILWEYIDWLEMRVMQAYNEGTIRANWICAKRIKKINKRHGK